MRSEVRTKYGGSGERTLRNGLSCKEAMIPRKALARKRGPDAPGPARRLPGVGCASAETGIARLGRGV